MATTTAPKKKAAAKKDSKKPEVKKAAATEKKPPQLTTIRLVNLIVDYELQMRASKLDESHVEDLMDAIERKQKLPPVTVFKTAAGEFILADGFHRADAHRRKGITHIQAEVHEGERIDAELYSTSCNQSVQLRRTTADKRKAITKTLKLCPKWADRRIAEHVGVSDKTVGEVRASLVSSAEIPQSEQRETSNGRTVKAKKEPKPKPEPEAKEPTTEATTGPEANASAPLEQTSAPAAAKMLDSLGLEVPERLEAAFTGKKMFGELVMLIRAARKLVTEIGESAGGALLVKRMQWMRANQSGNGRWSLADLDNALVIVEECEPQVADCPYAHTDAHDKDCPLCRGSGFTGKLNHKSVPDELIDKMKAARTAAEWFHGRRSSAEFPHSNSAPWEPGK